MKAYPSAIFPTINSQWTVWEQIRGSELTGERVTNLGMEWPIARWTQNYFPFIKETKWLLAPATAYNVF
jgi:hypothetical protein